jgi:hypothetical protein
MPYVLVSASESWKQESAGKSELEFEADCSEVCAYAVRRFVLSISCCGISFLTIEYRVQVVCTPGTIRAVVGRSVFVCTAYLQGRFRIRFHTVGRPQSEAVEVCES